MSQIIYGIHPVEEALKSPHLEFTKILIHSQRHRPPFQLILDLADKRKIPVFVVDPESLNRMVKGATHQNVVAFIKEVPYTELDAILSRARRQETKALLLVLDGIEDPQNLGALIRSALGFGAHGIVIPKDRAVGITPSVIKVSAGAAAHLPVARVVNIAQTLDALKHEGIWVYGAAGEAKDRIFDLDLTTDLAIVIGAEGKGMRHLVKKKCDRLFSIPMKGPVPSFNASVSGGIILYEVMRQRALSHPPVTHERKNP